MTQEYLSSQVRQFNDMLRRGQIANLLASHILDENPWDAFHNLADSYVAHQDLAREAFWELYEDDTFFPNMIGEMRARHIAALTGLEAAG